ncbi:NUDIX hydrolase [Paenibacillus sp. Marseille-P2973]|uniref:NUDIX hydrolase n=1 Tax=unclassified Paenibacillus TaxID=185978 RepID=UPI001B3630D3|nr:NUDIX hydrolase [Paenibacillus sp. Marseille-P2973]MBQ4898843.1 NUDIX hydrolase [Paenibacillus sp. Marseille-P2973]
MQLKWLEWAKQIQAISQAGLAYSKDIYDLERFEMLRDLSVEIMNQYTEVESDKIKTLFASETGYATPKVDVRGVIFEQDKILLVREKLDGDWALPGGWADIGLSPKEVVVKEVKEEAGLEVQPVRLLGVLDKKFHDHPPAASHVYKMFILCEVTGGEAQAGLETLQVGYFSEDELPPLSAERVTLKQIQWLFQTRNSAHEVWLD